MNNKTLTVTKNILTKNEIQIFRVETEEEIASAYDLKYIRLPTLDRYRPSDSIVNDLVEVIKNNPNSWLHFHCHVGKGRTTTFMAMYDMFYNAKNVGFEEILTRQKAIDGEDLMKHLHRTMDERLGKFSQERFEFLKNFYNYCKNSDPFATSWDVWVKETK
jgi:protein-tyrosine phosphatase